MNEQTPYYRHLTTEDRWILESKAAELLQNAERYNLHPIASTLEEIFDRLATKRRVTQVQANIIERLYAIHCGKWRAS